MKKIYLLFGFLFILFYGKGYSQADSCVVLGCASDYGSITTDNALPYLPSTVTGSCYNGIYNYKQIYWQFFYSNAGGDFTQTFTPTDGAPGLDIDWVMYDIGTSAPSSITCPIDHTLWTEVACNTGGSYGIPGGPGTADGTFTTTAGHYYAYGMIINPNSAVPSPGPNFSFTISNTTLNGSPFVPGTNCPGILPVKLISFDANVNNCVVNLNWASASETNFKDYEVQYSTNGSNFQTIATIPAALQSNSTDQSYSYQHNNPQQGNIYYRLKMVDIDGKFEYSKIIALKLDCSKSSTFVYPNPVTDILNVNITNSQNNLTIAKLFDSYGKSDL